MDPALRIVTQLPLVELWSDKGVTTKTRIRPLSSEDIACLLRCGHVQFVVVNVGDQPHWIALEECYDFWKSEVRSHLVAPDSLLRLDEFPNGYGYFASEWSSGEETTPIVVLERNH